MAAMLEDATQLRPPVPGPPLSSSSSIPRASRAPTKLDCKDHPHNEHFIVQNFEMKSSGCVAKALCPPELGCTRPSDILPCLGWLPTCLAGQPLRSALMDAMCGVTVAAVVVPQGMAYGMLAAVPPVYGLYTAMLPPLAYTLTGSCMHLAVGPFALIAMLTAEGVQDVVPHPELNPEAAVAAAGVIAFLSGCVLVLMGLLRLGFVATFLSDPVLSGYTTAVSVIIPTTQLKYALQVDVPRGTFIEMVVGLVNGSREGGVNLAALLVFVLSVTLLLTLQTINRSKRFPRLKKFPIPAELTVTVLATVACWVLSKRSPDLGVSVLGAIPSGLPEMSLPELGKFDLRPLISSVLTVSLMTYITAMSVSKTFARKFGYEVDNNQELLALGCANLLGSVSSSFPAAASFSRTAIAGAVGAATPLHNVWTVGVLALVLLFCGPLIETLPLAALSAIVAVSFKSLLLGGLEEMRVSWQVSVPDFVMWSVAFWSTLFTDVTIGIAIAVGADVLFLFWKSTMPSYSVLGRLKGTERLYRNRRHFVEAHAIRGLMIFRFDESLHFANREVFVSALWRELRAHDAELNGTKAGQASRVEGQSMSWDSVLSLGGSLMGKSTSPSQSKEEKKAVTAIVLDFSPMSHIDISGIRALERLRAGLAPRGTRLILAHCKFVCYQKLSGMGFFDRFEETGRLDVVCFRELHDAVVFAEGRLPIPRHNPSRPSRVSSPSSHGDSVGPPMPSLSPVVEMAMDSSQDPPPPTSSTNQSFQDRGLPVGHEELGHYEPLQRSVTALPTLLRQRSEDRAPPCGSLPKLPRAHSAGDLLHLEPRAAEEETAV